RLAAAVDVVQDDERGHHAERTLGELAAGHSGAARFLVDESPVKRLGPEVALGNRGRFEFAVRHGAKRDGRLGSPVRVGFSHDDLLSRGNSTARAPNLPSIEDPTLALVLTSRSTWASKVEWI